MFAAFSILEAFLSVLLRWIPFYFALKLAFLAWCFLPQTQVMITALKVFQYFEDWFGRSCVRERDSGR